MLTKRSLTDHQQLANLVEIEPLEKGVPQRYMRPRLPVQVGQDSTCACTNGMLQMNHVPIHSSHTKPRGEMTEGYRTSCVIASQLEVLLAIEP